MKPNKGKLSKVEAGNGTVQWARIDAIYILEEGIVGEIYVNEGEYIEAGKALFSIEYDRDENEWKLQGIENSRKKFLSEQRDTENKIQLEKYTDAELLKAKQSLTEAKKNLEVAVAFHEIGGVSTQELNEARNQVNYLKVKLDNLNAQEIENKQALQLQLEKIKLDLEDLSISGERYKKIQTVYDTEIVITAPQKGMIIIAMAMVVVSVLNLLRWNSK